MKTKTTCSLCILGCFLFLTFPSCREQSENIKQVAMPVHIRSTNIGPRCIFVDCLTKTPQEGLSSVRSLFLWKFDLTLQSCTGAGHPGHLGPAHLFPALGTLSWGKPLEEPPRFVAPLRHAPLSSCVCSGIPRLLPNKAHTTVAEMFYP